jgi:hypothetical protein
MILYNAPVSHGEWPTVLTENLELPSKEQRAELQESMDEFFSEIDSNPPPPAPGKGFDVEPVEKAAPDPEDSPAREPDKQAVKAEEDTRTSIPEKAPEVEEEPVAAEADPTDEMSTRSDLGRPVPGKG